MTWKRISWFVLAGVAVIVVSMRACSWLLMERATAPANPQATATATLEPAQLPPGSPRRRDVLFNGSDHVVATPMSLRVLDLRSPGDGRVYALVSRGHSWHEGGVLVLESGRQVAREPLDAAPYAFDVNAAGEMAVIGVDGSLVFIARGGRRSLLDPASATPPVTAPQGVVVDDDGTVWLVDVIVASVSGSTYRHHSRLLRWHPRGEAAGVQRKAEIVQASLPVTGAIARMHDDGRLLLADIRGHRILAFHREGVLAGALTVEVTALAGAPRRIGAAPGGRYWVVTGNEAAVGNLVSPSSREDLVTWPGRGRVQGFRPGAQFARIEDQPATGVDPAFENLLSVAEIDGHLYAASGDRAVVRLPFPRACPPVRRKGGAPCYRLAQLAMSGDGGARRFLAVGDGAPVPDADALADWHVGGDVIAALVLRQEPAQFLIRDVPGHPGTAYYGLGSVDAVPLAVDGVRLQVDPGGLSAQERLPLGPRVEGAYLFAPRVDAAGAAGGLDALRTLLVLPAGESVGLRELATGATGRVRERHGMADVSYLLVDEAGGETFLLRREFTQSRVATAHEVTLARCGAKLLVLTFVAAPGTPAHCLGRMVFDITGRPVPLVAQFPECILPGSVIDRSPGFSWNAIEAARRVEVYPPVGDTPATEEGER